MSNCAALRPIQDGGYGFAEDPLRDASTAQLFWRADVCGSVIVAHATPCLRDRPHAFDLTSLSWPVTTLRTASSEEAVIHTPTLSVRLSVQQGSLHAGPVELRYLVEPKYLAERLLVLQQWDALLRTGSIPAPLQRPFAGQSRWHAIVMTLDALAAGCSLRETATRVFGQEETARAWHDPSDYLKMRTRRLVARAIELAAGGYLHVL